MTEINSQELPDDELEGVSGGQSDPVPLEPTVIRVPNTHVSHNDQGNPQDPGDSNNPQG